MYKPETSFCSVVGEGLIYSAQQISISWTV